jgi:hypothetical protein
LLALATNHQFARLSASNRQEKRRREETLANASGMRIALCPLLLMQEQSAQKSTANLSLAPEQLKQLMAPIALYPDTLVAQILAASTYPTQNPSTFKYMQFD